MKPALARGELHCVGATTLDEYRKHIEKDAALARRFQPIFVCEPTVEDTISILRGLKEKYELHHGVRITDSAIVAAATLSNRYITDRFLPDKAIDLVDEAASRLRMQVDSKPEELDAIDRDLMQLMIEREALKKETDAASKDRLGRLEKVDRRACRKNPKAMTARWQAEKQKLGSAQKLKEELDKLAQRARAGAARGDLARAGELRYGKIPELEKKLAVVETQEGKGASGRRSRNAGSDRGRRLAMDGRAGRQDARRRARQASQDGGRSVEARHRSEGSGDRRLDRRVGARAPVCRIRTGRSARSCSSDRPASAKPS